LARSLLQRQSGDSFGHLGENGGSWRALPLMNDLHGFSDYRANLVKVMAQRALAV
jgi:hypothetical protein